MPGEPRERREQRLVFGEVAELYDKARPTYPSQLIDDLVARAGPSGWALDVGCGTGKATVLLAARGLSGIGLEPDPKMAAVARSNLSGFPAWSVETAEFEDYEPPPARAREPAPPTATRPFDLVTSAQAWHWLDPARRFQQADRLLKPGGWLAVFWNRTGDDDSPIRRDIDAVYAEMVPALSPHGRLTTGQPPAGAPPPESGFGEPSWQTFPWVRRYTTTEWIDLAQTHSDHRMLEPGQRDVLIRRLTEVIDGHGGLYDHPYLCWLWTARKLNDPGRAA